MALKNIVFFKFPKTVYLHSKNDYVAANVVHNVVLRYICYKYYVRYYTLKITTSGPNV